MSNNGKISPYSYSTKLLDCFTDPGLVQEFVLSHFKLVDLTVLPDEELVNHRRAALMELLEKHIRARNILPIIEFISEADIWLQIKNLENGKYLRFALKYLVDKGETYALDEAIQLIAKKIPEKGEEIMTIAEGLIKRGDYQRQLKVAHILLEKGMSDEAVAEITELPTSEIKKLH